MVQLLELAPDPIKTHRYTLRADISVAITLLIAYNYSRLAHFKQLLAC